MLLGYLVFVWMFLFMVAGGFIFSGSASAQQSTPLTVLQPNGGESWKAGNRYVLKWQSPTNAYKFNLAYSTDNKTTWSNITEVLASNACNNTGSYLDCKISWRIPPQNGNKPYSFVKVIAKENNRLIGEDVSDNAFKPDFYIRNLQILLHYLGYNPGPVDGIWGKWTEKAVELFCSKENLKNCTKDKVQGLYEYAYEICFKINLQEV